MTLAEAHVSWCLRHVGDLARHLCDLLIKDLAILNDLLDEQSDHSVLLQATRYQECLLLFIELFVELLTFNGSFFCVDQYREEANVPIVLFNVSALIEGAPGR